MPFRYLIIIPFFIIEIQIKNTERVGNIHSSFQMLIFLDAYIGREKEMSRERRVLERQNSLEASIQPHVV